MCEPPRVHGEAALPAPEPSKARTGRQTRDWKWSSYRHYAFRETGVIEIESQWTVADREQKARAGAERIFRGPG